MKAIAKEPTGIGEFDAVNFCRQLARDNADLLESKAAVVLMNEGWVHEKGMRR